MKAINIKKDQALSEKYSLSSGCVVCSGIEYLPRLKYAFPREAFEHLRMPFIIPRAKHAAGGIVGSAGQGKAISLPYSFILPACTYIICDNSLALFVLDIKR